MWTWLLRLTQKPRPYVSFDMNMEFVIRSCSPCLVGGQGRQRKEGGKGFDAYCFSIRHEFHDAQPTVAAVTVPLAVRRLGIKHHLGHILAGTVFVCAETDVTFIVCNFAFVSADDHADVGGGINQFLPDGFSVVGG